MRTPAIWVWWAVEGLTVVEGGLQPLVLPIAVVILVALFLIQSGGTARVGALFGPIVLVYFATLATLGVANIAAHLEIVGVINPYWAFEFFSYDTLLAFLAMGSVFLAMTRSEEHTSDLQSLLRISYAVFGLNKKNTYSA